MTKFRFRFSLRSLLFVMCSASIVLAVYVGAIRPAKLLFSASHLGLSCYLAESAVGDASLIERSKLKLASQFESKVMKAMILPLSDVLIKRDISKDDWALLHNTSAARGVTIIKPIESHGELPIWEEADWFELAAFDDVSNIVRYFPNAESAYFHLCKISSKDIAAISRLRQLKTLKFSSCSFDSTDQETSIPTHFNGYLRTNIHSQSIYRIAASLIVDA
jgi:hypothetical protein